MCTSFVVNKKKTLVGWNLDILDMEYRVREEKEGVYIEILDEKEGWLPLFGANSRGDFVGMPTCWPHDERSDPKGGEENILLLDIDLLLQKRTFAETKALAEQKPVSSVPGLTFMGALSDCEGNVLHIVPGQGTLYYERPPYKIMTNFSPFKGNSELHPWMGLDRYEKAEEMLREAGEDISAEDAFSVLRTVAQQACPTVVSMVYDVTERTVCWCEKQNWKEIRRVEFIKTEK